MAHMPLVAETVRCPLVRRRSWLRGVLAGACTLVGCAPAPRLPLRFGAQPWPGYELVYLARARRYFAPEQVRLIESPSASASLRALATGALDGAALTLDEVLTARERGLPMSVVAVADVSMGADVVMSRPGLRQPADLAGRRVGLESSATGAVMLDALLTRSGLSLKDVKIVPLTVDQHFRAYQEGRVDALVTYEPVRSRLKAAGAWLLFSSAEVPGRIVDTLAVRQDVMDTQADALRAMLAGHFRALEDWRRDPLAVAPLMAPRLGLASDDLVVAFTDLDFPDADLNRKWLQASPGWLAASAEQLQTVMHRAGLLARPVVFDGLADPRFLPEA
jgi:NitT/TauT family transport system substrate-binding protein